LPLVLLFLWLALKDLDLGSEQSINLYLFITFLVFVLVVFAFFQKRYGLFTPLFAAIIVYLYQLNMDYYNQSQVITYENFDKKFPKMNKSILDNDLVSFKQELVKNKNILQDKSHIVMSLTETLDNERVEFINSMLDEKYDISIGIKYIFRDYFQGNDSYKIIVDRYTKTIIKDDDFIRFYYVIDALNKKQTNQFSIYLSNTLETNHIQLSKENKKDLRRVFKLIENIPFILKDPNNKKDWLKIHGTPIKKLVSFKNENSFIWVYPNKGLSATIDKFDEVLLVESFSSITIQQYEQMFYIQ
jgi:hypothetical protein